MQVGAGSWPGRFNLRITRTARAVATILVQMAALVASD
jgi:hypothetical protein